MGTLLPPENRIGDHKFNLMPTDSNEKWCKQFPSTYALAAPIVSMADAAILKETMFSIFQFRWNDYRPQHNVSILVHFLKCDVIGIRRGMEVSEGWWILLICRVLSVFSLLAFESEVPHARSKMRLKIPVKKKETCNNRHIDCWGVGIIHTGTFDTWYPL